MFIAPLGYKWTLFRWMSYSKRQFTGISKQRLLPPHDRTPTRTTFTWSYGWFAPSIVYWSWTTHLVFSLFIYFFIYFFLSFIPHVYTSSCINFHFFFPCFRYKISKLKLMRKMLHLICFVMLIYNIVCGEFVS